MTETAAELQDWAIDVVEEASDRQLTKKAKRCMRDKFRGLAMHLAEHGGKSGRYWTRNGAKLEEQLGVLASAAVEHARSRHTDEDGLRLGVEDIQAGQKKAAIDCPSC